MFANILLDQTTKSMPVSATTPSPSTRVRVRFRLHASHIRMQPSVHPCFRVTYSIALAPYRLAGKGSASRCVGLGHLHPTASCPSTSCLCLPSVEPGEAERQHHDCHDIECGAHAPLTAWTMFPFCECFDSGLCTRVHITLVVTIGRAPPPLPRVRVQTWLELNLAGPHTRTMAGQGRTI